jgi:CRP-like cAMP-binding protein
LVLTILEQLQGSEVIRFGPGEVVLQQGETTGLLFVLIEGTVEIIKDDVRLAVSSEPGAVFGEMSTILKVPHTATVATTTAAAFYRIADPKEFFRRSPEACLHVCELLARRIETLSRYLVDVRHQFEGHDHLGMVDGILDVLLNRPDRKVVRPRDETARHGEAVD